MEPTFALIASLVALFVLVVATVVMVFRYLSINVWNQAGKGADRKTARQLKKFGLIRGFKVLSNITLEVDGKTARIENMLIGYFGILLVHTCGMRGEYYGTLDGESWIVSTEEGRNKQAFPNPVLEQQRAIALLRSLFAQNKLYKVSIEQIVHIASKSSKTGIFITHAGEILPPKRLPAYLDKTKFEADTGLDVAAVAALIQANSRQ